ncbi:Chromosome transmission fidelity protein 18 [Phytophthora boehmeriae]|uniref:Chromosome transmission fidelity protein 18 n=1 Tax=Phytophthora boehmeriae TaxID=109152 RepID=A0A8T1WXX7_9STRA|nr:Chromosome transmission fidelity protein 18 [Phytophthora boehmeriae]
MTDADVYAYEQEFEDEWEAMHAHEMEAAEEEMMAMEAAEQRIVSQKELSGAPEAQSPADRAKSAMDDADASLSRPQSRLDSVLARCATLLGEDEGDVAMEDVELRAARVVQKEKAATTSEGTTTAEFLYNRPPIDVDSLPVVLRDGRRRFLRKKQSSAESTSTTLCVAATPLISIREMMENIERIEIEEAASIEEEGNVAPTLETDDVKPPPVANTTLWLDKYRPQSFLDLLSDERTNREVLSWIKSWDLFVFPKKKRVNESHSTPPAKKSVFNSAGGKSPWNQQVTQNDYDDVEDKRPTNKIILICGPPGAGKTTLANIVARHAGYNPIEVNASDDRTPSVLRNKIVSAMEMQSIFGERKPNCIILDEIDGAMNGTDGRSAIEVIHEMAAAPLFKKKAGAKTSSKTRHPLVRPLICICNDMYASVLRPLRQLAKIFLLDTPHPQRLVTRLKFICRHEGIKASTGALAALCSSADNDIRYCLNTLQFQYMQSRGSGKGTSSLATLNAGLVGQKDHVHGMFEAMNLVFYESRSKSAKGEQPIEEKIEEAAISLGNYPLLINGLDENVPKMIFNDPTMKKICDVFEWLGLADAWETRARSEQQFVFQTYIPFAAIATHASCCTGSRRRVEYPRSHFEAQKRGERSQNILVSLTEGAQLQPSLRLSTSVLVVDVVPWIIATLSPNIRRINPSLQTKEEKTMIERLIQLMASLGLSFRHKYLPDGTEDYALEPALNELVMFRGTEGDAAYQSVLPLTVRKMIAREVELEQMRRIESTAAPIAKQNGGKVALGSANRSGDLAKSVFVLPELSEAELAVKDEASRKRNPFAFAHREAKRKRTEILKVQNKQQRPSKVRTGPVVRYKFNEGYTCGIKTTVYVRDLL